jgi:hypothetical protein
MIYQWTSLGLGLMVKKDNVLRPYITRALNTQKRPVPAWTVSERCPDILGGAFENGNVKVLMAES